jgi:hypothetical protein
MRVIAINGIAQAGKDTFVNFVKEHAGREARTVRCISTIDPIKVFYAQLGWDGTKTSEHRKNLNVLKQIWIAASNGPLNWAESEIRKAKVHDIAVLFVMVREFPEMLAIAALGKSLVGHGETLQVVRDGLPIPPVEQEFLDSHPQDYHYDWGIDNKTTTDLAFPELSKKAKSFWDLVKGEQYVSKGN